MTEFDAEWQRLHEEGRQRVRRALDDLTGLPVPEPAKLPKRTICPCQFTVDFRGEHLLTCLEFQ